MAISLATKLKVGFSLTLVGLLAIGGRAAFLYSSQQRAHHTTICAVVGGMGFLMWLIGGMRENWQSWRGSTQSENPLAPFKRARTWGLILLASTAVVYANATYQRPQPRPRPEQPKRATIAKPAVVFPPLKLRGIVFQGTKSSALINGEVVRIGEEVDTVQVVAIARDRVTVALSGQTNVLFLP